MREGDRIVLTDPRALRALAHPARTAVLDELYQGKVRTSSQLAQLTGLTPSAMSYHLRALEKWGIVVRAESVDGRERPWAAAAKGFSLSGRDAAQAATDVVVGLYLDRLGRDLAAWRRAEPPEGEWADTSQVSRGFPWLTADELREVNAAVMAVLDPYFVRDLDGPPGGQPPGRVPVRDRAARRGRRDRQPGRRPVSEWLSHLLHPDLAGYTAAGLYAVLFGLIFTETGLLVGFFLPGDTVLFTAGLLAAHPGSPLSLTVLVVGVAVAAVLGDAVGYWCGRRLGRPWVERRAGRLAAHLPQAEAFFARWGWSAVVVARFIPWLRTFTPIVAGTARMTVPAVPVGERRRRAGLGVGAGADRVRRLLGAVGPLRWRTRSRLAVGPRRRSSGRSSSAVGAAPAAAAAVDHVKWARSLPRAAPKRLAHLT